MPEHLYTDHEALDLYDSKWDAMALLRPLGDTDRGRLLQVHLTWQDGEAELFVLADTILDMVPVSTKSDEGIGGCPGYSIPSADMRGAAVIRVAVPEVWNPDQDGHRFLVVASDRLSEYRGLRRRVCIL